MLFSSDLNNAVFVIYQFPDLGHISKTSHFIDWSCHLVAITVLHLQFTVVISITIYLKSLASVTVNLSQLTSTTWCFYVPKCLSYICFWCCKIQVRSNIIVSGEKERVEHSRANRCTWPTCSHPCCHPFYIKWWFICDEHTIIIVLFANTSIQ